MSHLATSLSQSLAQSLASSIGGGEFLSFLRGTYANASPRNFFAKNPSSGLYEMTGPFAANTLATRKIGGHGYGLLEGQFITNNTYSEQYNQAFSASLYQATWSVDAIQDPLGNLTADKLCEDNTAAAAHGCRGSMTGVLGDSLIAFKAKAGERDEMSIRVDGVSPSGFIQIKYNTTTPSATVLNGTPISYGILSMVDGWYLCYFLYSDLGGGASRFLYLWSGGSQTYDGVTGYGMYFSQFNYIPAEHLTSYIQAVASQATKAKDVFYWANAALPSWLKGSQNIPFTFNFIPNYSSTQHAASAVDTFLFSVDGTENVECYIAGADQKLYIDVDSVNKFTSASAFAWDLHDTCQVTIIPNNGSNCRVITSGFNSGNADETGTSFSMQNDGDLYWAMRHTTNDLQLDGIQSVPRKGFV